VDVSLTGYEDALAYLFARTTGGFRFGLERTAALLEALGNPHRAWPALHIAGTNGKGSSVATADALLRGKGLRTGKYTSPHLVDFRERVLVNGEPMPAEEVVDFVSRWTPLVERLGATFFEATTAMAFDHFARAGIDVALVETGLGGRLDATNVLTPVAAGVTSIGLDHTEYLGDTLELIAVEKAGIFKQDVPAVIGEGDRAMRGVLAREARTRGALPVRVVADEAALSEIVVDDLGTTFTLSALGDVRRLRTPLAGLHQAHNVAFTLVLLHAAGPPFACTLEEAARHLPSTRIPGRFQRHGEFVFDVAHNAEGSTVLAQTLGRVGAPRPVAVLLSVLRDKDWRRMIEVLAPVADHFVLTTAPTAPASRAWNLEEAEQFARSLALSVEAHADFDAALAAARESGRTVLVTGSFHTVGDAMVRLQVSPLSG
jgi:dihydrofolate synthase / folylpolyglutamate synthase